MLLKDGREAMTFVTEPESIKRLIRRGRSTKRSLCLDTPFERGLWDQER